VTSNLEISEGRVFFGTGRELVCLDLKTGGSYFKVPVTVVDRPFPVVVRLYGKTVVYIGEMVVAGFDPVTGRQRFQYGMTPLSQEASLAGLDARIGRLEAKGKGPGQVTPGLAGYYGRQAAAFQEQSNNNRSLMRSYTSRGEHWKAERARLSADIDSAFSKAYSQITFHMAMHELGKALAEAWEKMADEGTLRRLMLMQRTILSAYQAAEMDEYVFRPEGESQFASFTVVHLPTGGKKTIPMSPLYAEYGLWNLLDPEKGVVYHYGLGPDPSGYVFDRPFMDYRMAYVRMYPAFLTAVPIELPR
jgi:hypothetical protein